MSIWFLIKTYLQAAVLFMNLAIKSTNRLHLQMFLTAGQCFIYIFAVSKNTNALTHHWLCKPQTSFFYAIIIDNRNLIINNRKQTTLQQRNKLSVLWVKNMSWYNMIVLISDRKFIMKRFSFTKDNSNIRIFSRMRYLFNVAPQCVQDLSAFKLHYQHVLIFSWWNSSYQIYSL